MMMLGRYIARGHEVAPDLDLARLWFERAIAAGVVEARGDLASLPMPRPMVLAVPDEKQAFGN